MTVRTVSCRFDANNVYRGVGTAQSGETVRALNHSQIANGVRPGLAHWDGTQLVNGLPALSRLRQAVDLLETGLVRFGEVVRLNEVGAGPVAVNNVLHVAHQLMRGMRLVVLDDDFPTEMRVNWCQQMLLGPADLSLVTAAGDFNLNGFFPMFAFARSQTITSSPWNSPLTYVEVDLSDWETNGTNTRLNMNAMQALSGTVAEELNVFDESWKANL